MLNNRYLLYIDILGFSDMVKNDYGKISKLFDYVNSLNVHRHGAFHTIVFSDTILIFNKEKPISTHDHEYLVMYACEFIQDLMCRSVDLEIQFRAILTYGEFHYERLSNIEAYHGTVLVNSHVKEKEINSMGLFIDNSILQYNTIFKTTPFDADLHFVYLMRSMEMFFTFDGVIPIPTSLVDEGYYFYDIEWETKILKTIKKNIDTQTDSRIRGKYLQTYHLYKQRYGKIIDILEKNNFDYKVISPNANWESSIRIRE